MKKLLTCLVLSAAALTASAEDHYLVGGCTPSGWTGGEWERSAVAMVNVAPDTWIWTGKLTVAEGDNGRFKIPDSAGGWDGYWAPEQDCLLTDEWTDLSTSGEGDFKYRVAEEGIYKVTLNTSTLKIKAEKLTEPQKDGDYYLISTVHDYYWWAGFTTSDNQTSKARLTDNLDFAADGFFPLSCDHYKFKGELDGQGHTLDGMTILGTNNNVALVRYASDGAYIHDLVVGPNSSFTGSAKIGGIVGFARDGGEVRLAKVVNMATVRSVGTTDANAAGLVGCAVDGTKITATDCANMGAVSGQDGQCGAFAGWTQSGTTFTNCFNCGAISNIDGTSQLYRNSGAVTATNTYDVTAVGEQGIKLDAATLSSGELCYKLNGDQSTIAWYQKIGTDEYPLPFGTDQVYANGELLCDGSSAGGDLTYSNSATSVLPPHSFAEGFCTVCGTLDTNFLTADAEGFYDIATANELKWFAAIVAQVNQSASARLTADIDYTANKQGFIGISQSTPFRGTFDGQGHTLTIDIVNTDLSRTGLFAYINAATIRNLIVEGSATSAGNNCVGGLGGRSDGNGTLIENVVVRTAVSYTGTNGDATCGGFFANMEASITMRNCAFYGSINSGTAEGNGGLIGWAGGGASIKIENCLVAATAYTQNGNSADLARNNPAVTNSYKVSADDPRLASGEMAYILNGQVSPGTSWYQLLGTDEAPLPFAKDGAAVYAQGTVECDGITPVEGSTLTFSNSEGAPTQRPHTYVDGICTKCGTPYFNYVVAKDGWYEFSNAKQLVWFAAMVNKLGQTKRNVRLTADIDFDGREFHGIGTPENPFVTTFDGQGHIIRNLILDNQDNDRPAGFINEAREGAVVKNMTMDASCFFVGHHYVGAFIGHVEGNGEILLEQLGNEAGVEAWNQNAGGIVGCNTSGELKLRLTNCYNTAIITGNNECGGISGWLGNKAETTNCYNMGDVDAERSESFARGNNIQVVNCFDPVTNWPALPASPIEDFTNGTIYQLLAEAAPGIWYLSAEEGGHPVLYETEWTPTDIQSLNVQPAENAARIYNLNGQQVQAPRRGLYIRNGRKFVVK